MPKHLNIDDQLHRLGITNERGGPASIPRFIGLCWFIWATLLLLGWALSQVGLA